MTNSFQIVFIYFSKTHWEIYDSGSSPETEKEKKKVWPGKYGDTDNNKSIVLCLNIQWKKGCSVLFEAF